MSEKSKQTGQKQKSPYDDGVHRGVSQPQDRGKNRGGNRGNRGKNKGGNRKK